MSLTMLMCALTHPAFHRQAHFRNAYLGENNTSIIISIKLEEREVQALLAVLRNTFRQLGGQL